MQTPALFRVCFVCTGNICRSPMAEAVFARLIETHDCGDLIAVDSAGTGDWHVGERADARARRALSDRGYDGSRHRARQFEADWFARLDLVLAFDRGHERSLRQAAPTPEDAAKVALLRSFDPEAPPGAEVPDPYYSDDERFADTLTMIERACVPLFRQLERGVRSA